jgi:pimeloyl-ACP methyl ester carboxylesterase
MPHDSTTPTTTPRQLTSIVEGIGPVDVTYSERGEGHPFLLLHGGAGPLSVTAFADLFARSESARVITPTHPGFAGTSRPERLASPRSLAALYVAFLDQLDLSDVTVIGNSIGGWIAAEMALLGSPRIGRVVLVDAVGIDVPGHPVVDFFSLTMDQVAELSYHDPISFRIDVSAMPRAQREAVAGNRAALAAYAGTAMTDATLHDRLRDVDVPTLVLWGEADRIVDAEYGLAFAAAIPGARFQLLPATGHVPQIETPQQLLEAIRAFVAVTP